MIAFSATRNSNAVFALSYLAILIVAFISLYKFCTNNFQHLKEESHLAPGIDSEIDAMRTGRQVSFLAYHSKNSREICLSG
jgi:hypothetical protein